MYPKLIIDTATSPSSLILMCSDHNFYQKTLTNQNASSSIYSYLEILCSESSIQIQDLQSIVVGLGPGSFTGIRIGLSLAQALSYSLKIPLKGYCSLMAYYVSKEDAEYISIFDAKSGGLFICEGFYRANQPYFKKPLRIPLNKLSEHANDKTFISPHAQEIEKRLSQAGIDRIRIHQADPNYSYWSSPDTAKQTDNITPLQPIYLADPNIGRKSNK